MPTYTSDWFNISDGDTTTHNPQTLASNSGSDIRILNADIEWEGVEATSTNTSYSTNTNSDTATATTDTSTNTNSDSVSDGTLGASVTIPDEPSGYTFTSGNATIEITNFESSSQSYSVEVTFLGNTSTLTGTIAGSSQKTIVDDNLIESDTGKSLSSTTSKSSIGTTVTASMTGEKTVSQTASTSYPSVPSGYSFDRHRHQEFRGGVEEVDDFIYTNQVGQTESITSNDPNTTVEVELETRGSTTNTSVSDTQDPSVSGDVSGSYTGTLDNGETSGWQTLSGLDANSETFNHSIGGSFEARFRFRFEWEYVAPTAVHTLRIQNNGTGYSVAIADTSDGGLEYNAVHVAVNGTIYALDMVDPTHNNALSDIIIQHPTYGQLSPRQIQ